MKLFEEKDQMAQILFYDLWYEDYKEQYDQVLEDNKKNNTKDGVLIYRNSYTTAVKYAKLILEKILSTERSFKDSGKKSAITYSDKNAFSVKSVDKTIDVSFSIAEDATVSVLVYTLDGTIVDQPLNNKPLSALLFHLA